MSDLVTTDPLSSAGVICDYEWFTCICDLQPPPTTPPLPSPPPPLPSPPPPVPNPPYSTIVDRFCAQSTMESYPATKTECYAMYQELYTPSTHHEHQWLGEHPPDASDNLPGACVLTVVSPATANSPITGSVYWNSNFAVCAFAGFSASATSRPPNRRLRRLRRRRPPPPTAGWFWGNVGESCTAACARNGQVCNQLWTRTQVLPDLQDYDSFVNAAAQADANTAGSVFDLAGSSQCTESTFQTQPWSGWPLVRLTHLGNSFLCGSSRPCRGESGCGSAYATQPGHSCATVPGTDDTYRLCYCLPGLPPSTPPSPPNPPSPPRRVRHLIAKACWPATTTQPLDGHARVA